MFDSELTPEQQNVLTTLLNCSLAWSGTSRHLDKETGQLKATITCVGNLSQVVFPRHLYTHQEKEDLRAFIKQA